MVEQVKDLKYQGKTSSRYGNKTQSIVTGLAI